MVKYAALPDAVSRQTTGAALSPARPTLASIEERSAFSPSSYPFGGLVSLTNFILQQSRHRHTAADSKK